MRGLFFAVFLLLLSISYSAQLSGYVHDAVNSTDENYWSVVRPVYEKGIIAFADFEACSENYGKFSYVVSEENSEYERCDSFEIEKAKITNKPEIAVFESEIMNNGMSVSWEAAYYLLVVEGRRYLNDQAEIINATGINEEIQGDVVVLPDFSYGYREQVVESITGEGCENLRSFVENGGAVFASGNALLILNKCELVNVSGNAMNGEYNISISEEIGEEQEFLVGGMDGDVMINNAPEIIPEGVVVLAEAEGKPVIAYKEYGKGFIVFTNANLLPYEDYEVFVNALMSAKSSKIGLEAEVITNASAENGLEENDVPAFEPDVSIQVINRITNYWNEDVEAVFYEEISDKFEYDSSEPEAEADGNNLNWSIVLSGGESRNLSYMVKTKNGTVDGYVLLSTAHAEYENKSIERENLYVNGKMSARLVGDRDIELDGWYPLPAEGVYFDIALPIENKEETMAKNITVVDIVVLKSPIVDVSNQSKLARARNESFVKGNDTYEVVQVEDENRTVYVNNTIYFYKKDGTFFMFYGPGGMIEDYNGHESEFKYPLPVYFEEIEYTYESDGQEYTLPALKMVYDYGELKGYDYEEPAIRYGIYSQEEGGRTVSFESEPINNTIICEGNGGSVYTNIGIHPIPYHEYLDYDEVYIPETTTGEISKMEYRDAWERSKTTELRTVFWDIVPFPPPEEHAVTSTTYEIKVGGRRVQILPADLNSTLNLRIGVFNGYPPYGPGYEFNMTIPYNESLIAESLPKGVGFKIEYTGWDSPHDKVGLTDQFYTDTLHTLIFNIELPPSELRIINVHADIKTDYETQRKEGLFKIDEGARQVYRQIAVGPNRYEVLDSRVKVARGEAPYVKGERRVSPVNIHTRGGNVYYNILLSDVYEPHKFSEPMIQSYGFGDVSATTYVGTRIKNRMYYAIIEPGDETVVRVEITNTKDVNLTDVEITPVVPEGWGYERLELMRDELPIFYDWEFLAERINGNIPPAWKGVWYYKITSPNGAENGVYEIPFEVEGNNLPNNFDVPPARISIGGNNKVVYSIPKNVAAKLNLKEYDKILGVKLCTQEDTEQILETLDEFVYEECEELDYAVNGNVLNIEVGDFTESEIVNRQNKSIIILMNVTPPHGGVVYLDDGYTILYSSDDGFIREKKDSRRMHITATGPYLAETKSYEIYVNGEAQEMLQYGRENVVVLHLRYYNNGNDIAYNSVAGYAVNGIPNSLLANMGAILPTQTYMYTTNITVIPRGGRMHTLLANGTLEFYDKLHDLRLNLLLDDLLIPVNKTSDDSSGITRRFSVAIEKCPLNISVYYDSRPKQARVRVLRILGGSGGVSEIYDNETSKAVLELENGVYKVEVSDSGFETYEKDVVLECIKKETEKAAENNNNEKVGSQEKNEQMEENSEGVKVVEKTEGNLRVKEYKSNGANIKIAEETGTESEQKNAGDNSMWILALVGGAAVVIVILGGFVYSAIKE